MDWYDKHKKEMIPGGLAEGRSPKDFDKAELPCLREKSAPGFIRGGEFEPFHIMYNKNLEIQTIF